MSRACRSACCLALLAVVPGCLLHVALAQEAERTDGPLDVAGIESKIAALSSLSEDRRNPIAERYRSALSSLELAERHTEREAELRRLAREAPQALVEAHAELNADAEEPEVDQQLGLARVRTQRQAAEEALRSCRAELARLEREGARRSKQRLESASREVEVQGRLEAIRPSLTQGAAGNTDDDPELALATRTALFAEQQSLRAELKSLEAERTSYDARRELLPVRIDRARLRAERGRVRLEAWQELEASKQRDQAERALAESARLRREVVAQFPQFQGVAEENHALALDRTGPTGLSARLERTTADFEGRRADAAALRESFRVVRRKVEAAGVTRAMGRLLRLKLDELPDTDALERQIAWFQDEVSAVQFELILREEARRHAGAVGRRVAEAIAPVPLAQRAEARDVARELLQERRDLLDAIIHEQGLLLERLLALREVTQEQIEIAQAFRQYVEERILWVRSVSKTPWEVVPEVGPAIAFLFAAPTWPDAFRACWETVRIRVGLFALGAVAIALVLPLSLLASRRRLGVLCERAWNREGDSFLWTLEGLLQTAIVALPIPVILLGVSRLLSAPPDQHEIARAWAAGLEAAASTLLVLEFVRILLCRDGLAEKHFRWRSQVTAPIRWHLRWFAPLATVTVFLVAALDRQGTTAFNDSLGLLAFVVQMGALTVLVQRTLRPEGALLSSVLQRDKDSWLAKLRYVWLPLAVGLPASLAVFALFGFHFSALLLSTRLTATCLLLLVLVLISSSLGRCLSLIRFRLAVEQAEQRKQAKAEEESGEVEGDAASRTETADKQTVLSAKSRQLIRSGLVVVLLIGLYGVWSDVLPALKRFERLQVYPTMTVLPAADESESATPLAESATPLAEAVPGDSSDPREASSKGAPLRSSSMGPLPPDAEAPDPANRLPASVTAADLGLSLLFVLLTVLLAKNLPALLQIVVLEKLPIDDGLCFAIVTVLRYGIVMIGGSLALSVAGISWASVQWLAAALTFGLAFGLQEIFANFVSGLIILFERPIRVGDAVTVGDVSGTVTRLRMRATTVTDWDNKELIIPNREFVTGQVINWSLSSPHMRLRLPVGIAYGSKTREAKQILLEVARSHPMVLAEPAPTAFLMGFGASALDFELRVFIPHPKHRFDVRDDVLDEINGRFADAGIEISYPQQDVHLKASLPILEALSSGEPAAKDAEALEAGNDEDAPA